MLSARPISETSRPTTQGSIQSSNSGLINIDDVFLENLKNNLNRKPDPHSTVVVTSHQQFSFNQDLHLYQDASEIDDGLDDLVARDQDNLNILANQDTSPLFHDFNSGPTNILLSSGLDFLSDIPSSCVEFAYTKISSELSKTPNEIIGTVGDSFSNYSKSSCLSHCAVDFNKLSPLTRKAFSRTKVIEEIIETEESYISSLKMLTGIYLDSIINKGNNGIPIKQLQGYLQMLISTHVSFLNDLRNLYSISYRSEIDDFSSPGLTLRSKGLISDSSPLMAALVAQLISKKAISVYLYQEYSSVHDFVLKLMDSKEDDPNLGQTLTRGFQNFLEASQNEKDRLDLSFSSLIQKPVQRIAKYKLFLDTLANLTPAEEDEECHKEILDCSIKVDYSIKEINRYGLQEKLKANVLLESLKFGASTHLQFPVEYLGLPLLIGSLYATWVGRDRIIEYQVVGAFLFKTHLVLATITKMSRFDVLFLIPLAVSNFFRNEMHDSTGGIYPNQSENSFKILFEYNYSIFEIFLISSDESEYSIWSDKIDLLINQINGPYKLNYSSSKFNEEQGTSVSTIIPPNILSYDVKLNKFKSSSKSEKGIFNSCYFKEVIPISIETIDDHSSSYSSIRFKKGQVTGDLQVIQVKQIERARAEYLLEDLWSDELLPSSVSAKRKKTTSERLSTNSMRHHFLSNKSNKSNRSDATRVSLMRRTSLLFGDALKSLFLSGD